MEDSYHLVRLPSSMETAGCDKLSSLEAEVTELKAKLEAAKKAAEAAKAELEAKSRQLSLDTNGADSDMVVRIAGKEYRVHKATACSKPPWFAGAMRCGFRESSTSIVVLPEDEYGPDAVCMMMHYFYHADYPHLIEEADSAESQSNLSLHARVFALGEEFLVDGLKELALEKFKAEVVLHWDTDDFCEAARVTYTSTPDGVRAMRDVVIETLRQHPDIVANGGLSPMMRDLDLGDFGREVTDAMVAENERLRKRLQHYRFSRGGYYTPEKLED